MPPGTEPAAPWRIAPIVAPGGARFGIAVADGATADSDPVAHAYRSGSVAPVERLLALAASVLRGGDRVLDLGAHLGGFALFAAARGCEVIAVEASPANAALLRQSATHNRFARLAVVHAAVGAEAGEVAFSSHGPWGHVATPADARPSETVRALRIDDLLAERGWSHVDFVKIDVEGSEIPALRGMARLLGAADAPLIWFESNRHTLGFFGDTPEALQAELRGFGYTIHRVDRRVVPVADPAPPQTETVVDYLAAKRLPEALRNWKWTLPHRLWSRLRRRTG